MINLSAEQMKKAKRLLGHIPEEVPKAMAQAINRGAETARTEASRALRENYYVKQKDVRSTIKLSKASENNLSARVISRGHAIALAKFRVTPKKPNPKRKRPIIVRVKRGQGGQVSNAFVARMQSGHVGVFIRTRKSRLPIQELYGPSVPQMLGSKDVRDYVEEKAAERLEERLDHEINRRLEGR